MAEEPGVDEYGILRDPKAYFFSLIGKQEESEAPDWQTVLLGLYSRGMWKNPKPWQQPSSDMPFHGITIMIDGGGNPRGRIWLPTAEADDKGYFTREVQVIADGPNGGLIWHWHEIGGNQYVPIPQDGSAQPPDKPDQPQPPSGTSGTLDQAVMAMARAVASELVAPLAARIQALEARPSGEPTSLPGRIALKDSQGKYVSADRSKGSGLVADRDARGEWEVFSLEVVE